MPDTTVKLQDITPVKSTFDNDDQLLLINPTGEARISKEDFLDAMPDDAITLIGDITTTGIEGDTVAKQLGALGNNSKAAVITETTESSAIANFTDGADDMPLHNILAEINPVQDLTYGDPYPAGGGKNILPTTLDGLKARNTAGSWSGNVYTLNNVSFTVQQDISENITGILVNATAPASNNTFFAWPITSYLTAENNYIINGCPSGSTNNNFRLQISDDITTTYSDTGSGKSFTPSQDFITNTYTTSIRIASGYQPSNLLFKPMICLASVTDATFAPYSNICPITGWSGCNVTRTGKNLLNADAFQSGLASITIGDDIDTITASTRYLHSYAIPARSGIAFSIKSHDLAKVNFYTVNRYVGRELVDRAMVTLTDTNTHTNIYAANLYDYVRVNIGAPSGVVADFANVDVQLELGSTATTYEPYQGTTLTVDWTSEAGTVYGGTIDVATGLLTVTEVLYQAKWKDGVSATVLGNNTRKGFNSGFVANYPNYTRTPTSNIAPYKASYDEDSLHFYVNAINGNNALIYLPNNTDGETDIQICYELKTPQTYQLTPQEVLHTLYGVNNVWADTGNVSVTYPADTKLYIEKLTMPTEDDMTANQAITSGKYFMIGNSLYLALANIASGAQITIGTNAQRVSLADALNTINS